MMRPLYRCVEARCKGYDHPLSFTLHAGEKRLLQVASRDEKNALIDCVLGDRACSEGSIEIAQGDRRRNLQSIAPVVDRRVSNQPMPLVWQPLGASRPERIGWVAANGGLISNLRIWENVTLPRWYHTGHETVKTEERVLRWLAELNIEGDSIEQFMSAQPHVVELWQRKLAGLLRALVQQPEMLVVDAALLGNVRESFAQGWVDALETYAAEGGAVLMIADKPVTVQWEKIA